MRGFAFWVVRVLPVADVLTLASLVVLFVPWASASSHPPTVLILLLVVPLTQYILTRSGLYDSHRVEPPVELVRRVLGAHLLSGAIVTGLAAVVAPQIVRDLAVVFASSFAILALVRWVVHRTLQFLRRRGFDQRNVLLIGSWEEAEGFASHVGRHAQWGLHLECVQSGYGADRVFHAFPTGEQIGTSIEEILKTRIVDEVLLSVGNHPMTDVLREAQSFEPYGVLVRAMFPPLEGVFSAPRVEQFAGGPSLAVGASSRSEKDAAMKRFFDFILSAMMLIVSAPLLAIIAVAIKLTSRGPVLFSQTRVGLNGRRFRMLKFRTMIDGAEYLVRQADRSITQGPIFKDPRDYRVTAIGRILRKFSLDELPQLWNVFRGEMSLVGPRPLPVYEAEQINGEYRRRFSVPPGLTCFWQVNGRSNVAFDAWMKYDLQYVDRWSLWTDTKLLLRTIPAVLSGRGGY